MTICTAAKRSHTQKSHQSDLQSCSWEMKEKKKIPELDIASLNVYEIQDSLDFALLTAFR